MEALRARHSTVQLVALAFALWSLSGAAVAFAGGLPIALNDWHGLLHLAPGVIGLWAYRSAGSARGYLAAVAAVYFGAVAWGMLDGAHAYGVVAVDIWGNLLHATEGAVAAVAAAGASASPPLRAGAP